MIEMWANTGTRYLPIASREGEQQMPFKKPQSSREVLRLCYGRDSRPGLRVCPLWDR